MKLPWKVQLIGVALSGVTVLISACESPIRSQPPSQMTQEERLANFKLEKDKSLDELKAELTELFPTGSLVDNYVLAMHTRQIRCIDDQLPSKEKLVRCEILKNTSMDVYFDDERRIKKMEFQRDSQAL